MEYVDYEKAYVALTEAVGPFRSLSIFIRLIKAHYANISLFCVDNNGFVSKQKILIIKSKREREMR